MAAPAIGWSTLAWMEKIMSKTSNARKERELTEAELDQIAGGTPSIPIPPPTSYAIGRIEARFPRLT